MEKQSQSPKTNAPDTLTCKICVRGIKKSTSEKALEEYFGKFGTITDTSLIIDPETGLSRGYAFITFGNDRNVDDCLLCNSHVLEENHLDVRRAVPKNIPGPHLQLKTNRIFLGGIPRGITEQEIIKFFNDKYSSLGDVKEVIIKKEKQSGRHRGFCFVSFANHHVVDKIMLENRFPVILNKKCEVRKADHSVPITGAPPSELENDRERQFSKHPGSSYDNYQWRYGQQRPPAGRRDAGYPYPPPPHTSHPYGAPMMDDPAMVGGGYGSYYSPYSQNHYSQSQMHHQSQNMTPGPAAAPLLNQTQYDHMGGHSTDRSYQPPYSSQANSAPVGQGYDMQMQRSAPYGAAPSSLPNSHVPQQADYSYHQGSYGVSSAPNHQTSGAAPSSTNSTGSQHVMPYGSSQPAAQSSSQSQPAVGGGAGSSYGSSYSLGSSSGSQSVAYPTRSYRPPTAQNMSSATAPSVAHRPY